jgi:hypothetical protein
MKTSKCLLVVSAIAFPFVMGCGSSTEQRRIATHTRLTQGTWILTKVNGPSPVITVKPLP